MTHFYVFLLTEAEVDEKTLLGPIYRLVCNVLDKDGRRPAKNQRDAIKLAARQTGLDDIYAVVRADGMLVERWPFTTGVAA